MRNIIKFSITVCALVAGSASATQWPQHPISIIVPGAPSAPSDVAARTMADAIGNKLGEVLVVENRPGAQGVIGMSAVAKAPADGYTFGITNLQIALAPSLKSNLPFDVVKSFAPVIQLTSESPILSINANLPINTLQELITYAKEHPGELTYGTGGSGAPAHLGMELLKLKAGIDLVHTPYKSVGPALTDMMGGHIDVVLGGSAAVQAAVATGKARALAVSAPQRLAALPDVPTLAEAGFPDIDLRGWVGVVAPAGTDPAIIAKMNAALNAELNNPTISKRFTELGAVTVGGTPEAFGDYIAAEVARWHQVVQDAKITVE